MLAPKPLLDEKWTDFPMYILMAGPSDDSAANPGMFTLPSNFRFNSSARPSQCIAACGTRFACTLRWSVISRSN